MGVEEEVWGFGLVVGIRGVMERVMAWTLFIDQLSTLLIKWHTPFMGKTHP